MARSGDATDGTVFFALEQTKGRGQRSKQWLSNHSENIMMSIIADCSKYKIQQQVQLSMATAIACFTIVKNYTGDETSIKWPNDLYWRDRKAGGILIENIVSGENWEKAIIGIGININQTDFGEMESKAVSIKQITGKNFDPIVLAREICIEIEVVFQQLLEIQFSNLLNLYNKFLYKKDEVVKFKQGNIQFEAKVKRVNEQGKLVIEQGFEREIGFGEIEWIL